MNKYFLLVLLGVMPLIACTDSDTQTSTEKEPDALPSAISAEQQALLDCLAEPEQICQIGLWFAMIGDPVNDLPLADLGPQSVTDSVFSEEGYVVVRRTVYLKEGSIMIEGEYLPEAEATDESLNLSKVNRIYVRSTEYATQDDLRVGESLQKLLDTYGAEELQATSIPAYETIAIAKPNDGHIIYHFANPDNQIGGEGGSEVFIADLPKDWVIKEIAIL